MLKSSQEGILMVHGEWFVGGMRSQHFNCFADSVGLLKLSRLIPMVTATRLITLSLPLPPWWGLHSYHARDGTEQNRVKEQRY